MADADKVEEKSNVCNPVVLYAKENETDKFPQAVICNDSGHVMTDVGPKQALNSDNTQTITSATASVGTPWIGEWSLTRSIGVVRILVVLASTDTSEDGLGGTFTFEFSDRVKE